MTHPNKSHDIPHQGHHAGRIDKLIQEFEHDPYHPAAKPPEPAQCPVCGAVFHEGRWQWIEAPQGAHRVKCPACRRVRDHLPAGYLTLAGPFVAQHRDEVMHVVHHHAQRERAEHPMDRIMTIEPQKDGLLITFTEAHLARGTGEAVHHAFQGKLEFHYVEEDPALRVTWRR
jgi:NMD protein affecting ribosome stability and mRNA decay